MGRRKLSLSVVPDSRINRNFAEIQRILNLLDEEVEVGDEVSGAVYYLKLDIADGKLNVYERTGDTDTKVGYLTITSV